MTRLTLAEAEELIDARLYGLCEVENAGLVTGTVIDSDVSEARDIADAFIAGLGRSIDPNSIAILADQIDDMDVPCVAITIKVNG